jgi:AraC-like DNA-binding protein/quercetin dioxygenase-like cupin family protein
LGGHRRHLHADADHAEIVAMNAASGTSVELMRTSYRTQVFPRHTHDYFTVGVVLQGAGTLWYRGANRTTHRDDIVVIPPGEVHTGGVARGTKVLSYFAVHVPADVVAACADGQGIPGGRTPDFGSLIVRDPAVGAQLRRLNESMLADGAADETLTLAIGLLVSRHSASSRSEKTASPIGEPGIVRIAREIIEDCYSDNAQTSLQALARRTGVTPFHLVRLFTRTIGLPPHRYLLQTRVRRARELLARGVPSSFVAAMTGFADQSHLTTQFKRYVGTTPVSYQRCFAPRTRLPLNEIRP